MRSCRLSIMEWITGIRELFLRGGLREFMIRRVGVESDSSSGVCK